MLKNFSNPLPGVPSVESPFFDLLFDPSDRDYAVAKQLNEKGFAVLDFPDEGILETVEAIKDNLCARYDWDAWRSGKEAGLRIQDAWMFDENVRKVATHPNILSLLSRLYGRQAWPFQTLNFPVGTQQHFHTDSVHFSSIPERFMCGVWLALEDIDLDQGPLVYYPGSHRWPIYTNEHIGRRHSERYQSNQTDFEDMWRQLVAVQGVEPERLKIKKGSALIWASNLLHGGDIHLNKDKTRWSQVTHYYFDDCAYYTPMNSDPALGVVQFRRPWNIITGEPASNWYVGQAISDEFVAFTSPSRNALAGFEPSAYLEANPDVAAAGVDPLEHYTLQGLKERRPLKKV